MKNPQRIPVYDLFEQRYEAESQATSPALGALEGIFTYEQGQRIRMEGFHDGGEVHRLRFMPTAVGPWGYRVNLDGRLVDKGAFLVCAFADQGALAPGSAPSLSLLLRQRQSLLSDGQHRLQCHRCAPERQESLPRVPRVLWCQALWLGALLPCPDHLAYLGGVVWPWGGAPEEPDFATFDHSTFYAAEGVIEELANRGIGLCDSVASIR